MKEDKSILLGNPLISEIKPTRGQNAYFTSGTNNIIASRGKDLIKFVSDGHLISVAPTGAGKGRSAIIPNLLNYVGPTIVVDPKGECFRVTSQHREQMGHKIIKIDPFNVIKETPSDSFNPFDIIEFTGETVNDEVRSLVEIILGENEAQVPYPLLDSSAKSLIIGLTLYLATAEEKEKRNFSDIRSLLYQDDQIYNIAVLLDTKKGQMLQEAYEEMANYLQANASKRNDILVSAQRYLKHFGSPSIRNTTTQTSFDLKDVIDGKLITIYLIVPPSKLLSHRLVLKVWVGAFLSLISTRKKIPEYRTLFILDEVAQLGNLQLLEASITLLRGYGLMTWCFWQDLSQLKKTYPNNWESMLNNCSVVQLFGARNYRVVKEFAEILGIEPKEVKEVAQDEQILIINNEGPLLSRRLDYLNDTLFKGKFSPNPLYENINNDKNEE